MPVSRWSAILAALTRAYPFLSGCGTLANHRLMRILAPPQPDLVWAKSVGGDIQVFLDDFVGRAIFFFGDLDPKITWILRRLLKPGDTVLDVGANFGLVSLLMSKLVGPQGQVHAFEPNPMLCRILEATFARNGMINTKLHSYALGASNTQMELQVPQGNFGAASLVRRTDFPVHMHEVPVKKLDEVIAREPISEIALIKLDVEGFELEVLDGGRRVLREIRPRAILFESNEAVFNSSAPTPVMTLLNECEYQFIAIPRCITWMSTRVLNLDHPNPVPGHDLIAVRAGDAFGEVCQLLRATGPRGRTVKSHTVAASTPP
jgi:FkbM family methyltransferase